VPAKTVLIFPGPVRDMSGCLGFRRAGRVTMGVRRGMVRQRDSERAAEMRWCWVWQHFSLNALECDGMEKLARFYSPKMPNRRPMSQPPSPHRQSLTSTPISRVGVRPRPGPKHASRTGPSLVRPRSSYRNSRCRAKRELEPSWRQTPRGKEAS